MTDRFRQAFLEEVPEHLSELETALLELDDHPGAQDLVQRVFRALHTIKGSSAMFGFDAVSKFTHELETAFDAVRDGRLGITADLVNVTLEARDQIRAMLLGEGDGAVDSPAQRAQLLARLAELCGAIGRAPAVAPAAPIASPAASAPPTATVQRWRISFRPASDLLQQGADPLLVLRDLRALGALRVVADTSAIPPLRSLEPELCYVGWTLELATAQSRDAIRDVFVFVEDNAELVLEPLADAAPAPAPALPTVAPVAKAAEPEARPAREDAAPEVHEPAAAKASVRVAADKLDALVNFVGELVVVQARLSDLASRHDGAEMTMIAEEIERLTAGLRDNTMSLRMLPLRGTFERFRRLIHDLTRELGKEIVFRTEGADTELDKTVIEQLGDPLLHLIRNCADHGIEAPDVRAAAGKPRAGTISLSAVHSGANVLIRIADDGRGLDADAIRARAIEKGLISADTKLTESETLALIMRPGFSTAKQVTGISGRGVGMDVVQRSVDALRGTIEVATKPHEGTEVTLRLPLTLAIIDGLLVRVGATHFVLPLSAVVECIELAAADRTAYRNVVNVRGELIPYIPLREHFGIEGQRPPIEQIMIAETRHGRCGFVVDQVLGNHQTVIKTLGRVFRHVQVISGSTILGDGSVALILDPHRLVQAETSLARRPEHAWSRREQA